MDERSDREPDKKKLCKSNYILKYPGGKYPGETPAEKNARIAARTAVCAKLRREQNAINETPAEKDERLAKRRGTSVFQFAYS